MPQQKDNSPTPTVLAVAQMAFEGHVIPHTWYDHITYTTDGGAERVDLQAIIILSDIVYWYRPKRVMDEETGKLLRLERRFSADKLQRNYQQLSEQFGLSKNQAARAVKRLRDLGLVTMEFRTVETSKGNIPNVLFLEPVPERLAEITYPFSERARVSLQICKDTPTNLSTYPNKFVRTNTKNTSKTTPIDEKEVSPPERKPDLLDAMLHFQNVSAEDNWAAPSAAGGADDWQAAVDAFARHATGQDPGVLTPGERREWARVLENVGAARGVGPSVVVEVIRKIPESEDGWRTFTTPHAAEDVLRKLVGQHLNGGVRQKEKKASGGNGNDTLAQIEAFRAKLARGQPVVDGEWRMVGETL